MNRLLRTVSSWATSTVFSRQTASIWHVQEKAGPEAAGRREAGGGGGRQGTIITLISKAIKVCLIGTQVFFCISIGIPSQVLWRNNIPYSWKILIFVIPNLQWKVFLLTKRPSGAVPECIDPRFRESKPKTLVFSHRKRAFWACFANCVYNFGHGPPELQSEYSAFLHILL